MAGQARTSLVRIIVSDIALKTSAVHSAIARLGRGARVLIGGVILLLCAVPFSMDLVLAPDLLLSLHSQPKLGSEVSSPPLWTLVGIGLLLFSVVCVARRAVIAVVCLSIALSNLVHPWFGGWQLLAFFCASTGMVFIYEAIIQNFPLVLMLAKNPKGLISAIGRACWIWSPVLLLIAAGFCMNSAITRRVETILFLPDAVSRYCGSDVLPDQSIPCDHITKPTVARVVVPDFTDAIRKFLLREVDSSQAKWMEALTEAGDDVFSNGDSLKQFVNSRGLYTSSTEVAGLGPRTSQDPRIVQLNYEIDSISSQLRSTPQHRRVPLGIFGRVFEAAALTTRELNPHYAQLLHRRTTLEAQRDERHRLLTTELSQEDARLNSELDRAHQVPQIIDAASVAFPQEMSAMDRRMQIMLLVISNHQAILDQLPDTLVATQNRLIEEDVNQDRTADVSSFSRRTRSRFCQIYDSQHGPDSLDRKARYFDCSALTAVQTHLDVSPRSVDSSFHTSVEAWKNEQNASAEQSLRSAVEDLKAGRTRSVDAAMALEQLIPKSVDLGRDGCNGWVFDFPDCFKDKVREKGEGVYAKQRVKAGAAYAKEITQTAETGQARSMEALVGARHALIRATNSVATEAHRDIQRTVDAYKYFVLSSSILLVMACIRSALTSFSIAAFDAKGLATFGLSTSSGPHKVGEIDITSSLRLSTKNRTSLTTRSVLHNQEKRVVITPWPFFAVFARLRSGCYWLMNRGGRYDGTRLPLLATLGASEAFVHWELKAGEKVVFLPSKLFGVSESVSLRTEVSLRVSTLMLGRLTFAVAECTTGKGHLFLTTSDQATQVGVCTTEVDRLIAWSHHMQFQVVSARSIMTLVKDGFTVKVPPGPRTKVGKVVIEPVGKGVGTVRRIWRTLASLLSPF